MSIFFGGILFLFMFLIIWGIAVIFLFKREWKWAIGFFFIPVAFLIFYFNYPWPEKVIRKDIIGKYEIDTLLYPGKNIRWQFKTYSFEITNNDSILLSIKNAGYNKLIKAKIEYIVRGATDARSDRFRIISKKPKYHIFNSNPTLYGTNKRFYYVFESPIYQNMFFRKKQ